jgi:hypothetical protein
MIFIEGLVFVVCLGALILSVLNYIEMKTYSYKETSQFNEINRCIQDMSTRICSLESNEFSARALQKLDNELKVEREESLDSIY